MFIFRDRRAAAPRTFVAGLARIVVLLSALLGAAHASAQEAGGATASSGLFGSGDGPLRITVTQGDFRPTPIAVPIFSAREPGFEALAKDISEVVAADLQRSGLFDVSGGAPLESVDVTPNFGAWRGLAVENLVAGSVGLEPDGRIGVRMRLWDVKLGEQVEQLRFLADPAGWRRVAHKVADVIYSKLTGEDGYFDSRVVFVEESGPKDKRIRRLAIMDQDGANLSYLTDGDNLVLTPRFSPVEQTITFVSDAGDRIQIYLLNLVSEREEALADFSFMAFAPRFSPGGDQILVSLARRGGATNIYLMELATRRLKQLTSSPGIDTAPSFSPDGKMIVFESDRGSSQQLYVMNADGTDQKRISFGDGRYATPVWSPKGDLIAFTKIVGGQFHIGVMRPDGSNERLLTSSFLDEGPTWAPNGRVIMFFRQAPGAIALPQLYTVDIYGRKLQRVPTPAGASDPAWSPLLSR